MKSIINLRFGYVDTNSIIDYNIKEPFLFSGTLRSNIDPFFIHDDDQIWRAIDNVRCNDNTSID